MMLLDLFFYQRGITQNSTPLMLGSIFFSGIFALNGRDLSTFVFLGNNKILTANSPGD